MKVHFDVGMYQVDTNQQEFFLFCKKDFKKKKILYRIANTSKTEHFWFKRHNKVATEKVN